MHTHPLWAIGGFLWLKSKLLELAAANVHLGEDMRTLASSGAKNMIYIVHALYIRYMIVVSYIKLNCQDFLKCILSFLL